MSWYRHRVYGEQCLAAVWTFYTKDRQILYLCPQLGISVDIDMVDHLVFGFPYDSADIRSS